MTDVTNISGQFAQPSPKRAVAWVWDLLARVAVTGPRKAQLDRMTYLTDAELAARGLSRSDVRHVVFRDRLPF